MQAGMGAPAPQGPSQVPGAGADGVASGIDPAGAHLSKEGIDGTPRPKTTFRYGEDDNAIGDKGRALIQRPGIPPLITRPAAGTGGAEGGTSGVSVPPAIRSDPGAMGPSAES
jgi:hypothetical protein